MKKFNIFLTAILLSTCLFFSCKKEEIKLLESITYYNLKHDIKQYDEFKYDDQNRIAEWNDDTFIYDGDDLVSVGDIIKYEDISYWELKNYYGYDDEEEINGRFIRQFGYIYHLSNDDNLIRLDYYNILGQHLTPTNYIYDKNDNLIKVMYSDCITECEYDNKKAPFIHCNTPKWWLQANGYEYNIKNNVIKIIEKEPGREECVYEYKYEYDDDGYPIKCTEYRNGKVQGTKVYKYIFPGK